LHVRRAVWNGTDAALNGADHGVRGHRRIRPPSRRNIEAFRDWAARLPDTVGVFVVAGSEDFLLHVAVADNQHLYAFVIDKLTERPEVADVRTSVIYEHLRNHAVAPEPQP